MYLVAGEMLSQVYQIEIGETWMTPYQLYLADGILPLEPTEARKIKKNSTKYTLIDGKCTDQVIGSDDVAASDNIGVSNGTPG